MNTRWLGNVLIGACLALLPCGCGSKSSEDAEAGRHETSHEESEAGGGATFSEGRGLLLSEETRRALGVEVMEAVEGDLQNEITVPAQIYREAGETVRPKSHARHGYAYASAFLDTEKVSLVGRDQPVRITWAAGSEGLPGRVVHVEKELDFYTGSTEILIEIPDPQNKLKFGSQLQVVLGLGKKASVVTIPASALLQASEGNFVYVVNGKHLLRTAVEIGASGKDRIEILSGLYSGDQVVVKPVESLWLTELRATKGGGHSH